MSNIKQHLRNLALGLVVAAFPSGTLLAQVTLDPAWRVSGVDTNKPGFIWSYFSNPGANTGNNTARTERDLAGQAKDASGAFLPNLGDPNQVGAAIAAAAPANPANGLLRFEIASVINLSKTEATADGYFPDDLLQPGVNLNESTDGQAAEIITYLTLPAGTITMSVRSDDGFKCESGPNPQDLFGRSIVGERSGGAGELVFSFVVQQAGTYPFRTIWENGGGGSFIEWFTVDSDGVSNRKLINDVANGGIPAYRALTGAAVSPPYVKTATPEAAPRQAEQTSRSLTVVLSDGSTALDDNSVTLTVDGQSAPNLTKQRQGNLLTVDTGIFPGLHVAGEAHTGVLTFKDSTGAYSRTQQWTFYNLENLILPASPVTGENFDSYPEATSRETTVPPGWVATNFTYQENPGWDLTDIKSDAFLDWVLITTDTVLPLEDEVLDNDKTQLVNGQPVTNWMSGNLIFVASDGRASRTPEGALAPQVQFVVSAPFNLSTVTNPVLTFSSGARLSIGNPDQMTLEYSIDGGTNWLPAIYMRSSSTIILNPDGSYDALAMFNKVDTNVVVQWPTPGVGPQGGKWGDALAAPISQALAPYIANRNDGIAARRVEAIRLPQASKQSDVRLRMTHISHCGWEWGIDNIAFYDIAGTVQPPTPEPPKVTGQWDFDQGDLRATVGQDMDYGDALVKAHTSFGTTTSFGIPDIGGKPATVMKFTRIENDEYPDPANKNPLGYLTPHGMAPNGVAPDGTVGTKVNQFTMIVDMMNPDLHVGDNYNTVVKWEDIDDLARDGSISIQANDIGGDNTGGIGISGQYRGDGVTWIIGGQWQRIVVAVDMAAETPIINYYIDGVKFGEMTSGDRWGFDKRHAIPPVVRLYGDGENDNEVNTYYVNSVQFRNATMTEAEAAALGAPTADGIPNPNISPPPAAGPTISFTTSGTSLTLSWPASATGYTLESANSLSNPTWTAVPGVANNSVTVQTGPGSKFYRLRK